MEQDLKSQSEKLLETQYKKKDSILRKWKKLTKTDKVIFEAQHPDLCRRGQIQYPIEDLLLICRPKLHGIKGRPIPLPDPDPLLGDLVGIADFLHTFHSVFHSPSFSPIQLKAALSTPQETNLIKEVLIALETVALGARKKKNRSAAAQHLALAELLEVDLGYLLQVSYLPVLEDVLISFPLDDSMTEIIGTFPDRPLESHFYQSYSIREKLDILRRLVEITLLSKPVRSELQRLIDDRHKLERQRRELTSKLKRDLSVVDQLHETEKRLQKMSLGPRVLGMDRDFREYMVTGSDQTGVYVRYRLGEDELWRYLSATDVKTVSSALHSKGTRERKLKFALASLNLMNTPWTLETLSPEAHLPQVKELLFAVERELTTSLELKKYAWSSPDFLKSWHEAVTGAVSGEEVAALFGQFLSKSASPVIALRSGGFKECPGKYRDPATQQLWRQMYEKMPGIQSLAFHIMTFMGACQVRLKRIHKEESTDSEDTPVKSPKVEKMDSSTKAATVSCRR